MPRRLTTSEFITRSQAIHGEEYDYSLVSYTRNKIKVTIICPKHGPFNQTPDNHLQGQGCRICGLNKEAQARILDLTGQRFGRLVVIRTAGRTSGRRIAWLCHCDCRAEVIVAGLHLRRGHTKSCGCLNREIATQRIVDIAQKQVGDLHPLYKHGHTIGRKHSPEYGIWHAMIQRCNDPNTISFPRYGAKGIQVCDRWLSKDGFENFLADMGPRPRGTSLGRLLDLGNYEPRNVFWQTRAEQAAEKCGHTAMIAWHERREINKWTLDVWRRKFGCLEESVVIAA